MHVDGIADGELGNLGFEAALFDERENLLAHGGLSCERWSRE
jgi:hypothetical protein